MSVSSQLVPFIFGPPAKQCNNDHGHCHDLLLRFRCWFFEILIVPNVTNRVYLPRYRSYRPNSKVSYVVEILIVPISLLVVFRMCSF
jgi:hypothetical protein